MASSLSSSASPSPSLLWLNEVGLADKARVGGKNASLGEMLQNLTSEGIKVPNGFAITTETYKRYISHNNLQKEIDATLASVNPDDVADLRRQAAQLRLKIYNGSFPKDLEEEIVTWYNKLSSDYNDHEGNPQKATDVAVRSSAIGEDTDEASFAGQQDTFLNVRGDRQLINCIKKCFSSLFTDRVISYRHSLDYKGETCMSVTVQKMVRSDIGSSGVAFSLDTETGFDRVVLINGAFGLGELVVSGAIKPDEWIIFKETMSIVKKKLGHKDQKMVYGGLEKKTRTVKTAPADQRRFCLSEKMALQLAESVMKIEKYYSAVKGKATPVDIEWGVDGISGELFIVQARPETVHSRKKQGVFRECLFTSKESLPEPLATGIAVGDLISNGVAKVILTMDERYVTGASGSSPPPSDTEDETASTNATVGSEDLFLDEPLASMSVSTPNDFKPGDILVTEMTDPHWEPLMKLSGGIVTVRGGRTCHAAVIARELGIPSIVGCSDALKRIKNGQMITLSCAEGCTGKVYDDKIPFKVRDTDLNSLTLPSTRLMMNVGSPENAYKVAGLPHHGVGLMRLEFTITSTIGVHPNALLNYSTQSPEIKVKIAEIMKQNGYADPVKFYIEKLSYGMAEVASAMYPHPVIVRFSDFKTNEYRGLLGGERYEPHEENPMIGYRGAARYYSESFREAFKLECLAVKRTRQELGLKNVIVMVPFCRTPWEMQQVLTIMAECGLERGVDDLQVYLMCELPSNVILAAEFCKLVDGFSIGSNDLTQTTLAVDRDSALVAHLYDERNPAVKAMIEQVVKTAHENGCKVGICGQGPSDYPDFAAFLTTIGIDTISVTPDAMLKTIQTLSEMEREAQDADEAIAAAIKN